MIRLIHKIMLKIVTIYRVAVFKSQVSCNNKDIISIYGPVHMFADNVSVKGGLKLYPNVCFMGKGKIEIGKNVAIGNGTIIYASSEGGIYIGDNVSIAAHSYIIDCDHKYRKGKLINEQGLSSKAVCIGDDVWIADNCTILKGSNIGSGTVIGAKSLVKGNVPENAVCIGVPARVIKFREDIEEINNVD